jgi:hypothetical protein
MIGIFLMFRGQTSSSFLVPRPPDKGLDELILKLTKFLHIHMGSVT